MKTHEALKLRTGDQIRVKGSSRKWLLDLVLVVVSVHGTVHGTYIDAVGLVEGFKVTVRPTEVEKVPQ